MVINEFGTKEEGIKLLKEKVALRNKMGGALYWNVMNDECHKIADVLMFKFKATSTEILTILN